MELRGYQKKAIEAIELNSKNGIQKQVMVLATGLGKTVIFSHLIADRIKEQGGKALIIAHREELLTQAKDKLEKISPTLKIGIEQAEKEVDKDAQVIIASVQTIGRNKSKRIGKFNPKDFHTIVIDEAHHSSASTYKNILETFGILKNKSDWNKETLLLGATATPRRNDNEGIDKIFDKVAFNYGIVEGIQDDWLSRIRAYRVDTETDLKGVHTTAGDFSTGELQDKVNNPERNNLIVKTYKDLLDGKQALCFSAGVEHAKTLSEEFITQGISCDYVLGTTPTEERKQKLEDFKNRKINVMVNAMVLTEGYDNETIEAILMARPTKSAILFQQMVGRGTRKSVGKEHLTVVDFTDNTYKHKIQTVASLLGIEGKINFRGKDILESKTEIDKLLEISPYLNPDRIDMDKIQYLLEEIDLMSGLQIPNEIAPYTSFEWHRFGENAFRITLGDNRFLVAEKTLTNQTNLTFYKWEKEAKVERRLEIGNCDTLSEAIIKGDKFILDNYPEATRLVATNARWRFDKPSDRQVATLIKLGVSQSILDQVNKGEASRLLDKLFALNTRKYT